MRWKHVEYLAKMSGAKVHFFHALPDASAFVTAYSFGLKEFENQAEVKAVEKLKKNHVGNRSAVGSP